MVNYGGDEVSALVLDIGSSSVRAGYAGDDTPKAVIPTAYGYILDPSQDTDVSMADPTAAADEAAKSGHKMAGIYVGNSEGPSFWRPNMHIGHPVTDGLIQDWDPVTKLIEHSFDKVMRCDVAEHPVLCTEPTWNTTANRERMAEIMFEQFNAPAFYISNTGVLNSFSAGKGSSLVVDIGHSMASVTPVVDGFVLRRGLTSSPLPKTVRSFAYHSLTTPNPQRPGGIELYPRQLISNKLRSEPFHPANFQKREDRLANTTSSWLEYARAQEVDEWTQTVAAVIDQGWNDQNVASRPPKAYEFQNGYNASFGTERFVVGEQFFHTQVNQANALAVKTLPYLIGESMRACDTELRQVLMANIVLTGGGSLFSGLAERLHAEMQRQYPHVKIHAPGNTVERRFGAWIGGSILASLGTFHQLWISREEWNEHGKAIVAQRCK